VAGAVEPAGEVQLPGLRRQCQPLLAVVEHEDRGMHDARSLRQRLAGPRAEGLSAVEHHALQAALQDVKGDRRRCRGRRHAHCCGPSRCVAPDGTRTTVRQAPTRM